MPYCSYIEKSRYGLPAGPYCVGYVEGLTRRDATRLKIERRECESMMCWKRCN